MQRNELTSFSPSPKYILIKHKLSHISSNVAAEMVLTTRFPFLNFINIRISIAHTARAIRKYATVKAGQRGHVIPELPGSGKQECPCFMYPSFLRISNLNIVTSKEPAAITGRTMIQIR